MHTKQSQIEQFVDFSNELGKRIDFVQGGGGNTSCKTDDKAMLIKASGYYLSEVSQRDGYAVLSYPQIKDFFLSEEAKQADDIEEVGSNHIQKSILEKADLPVLRPSVEAGFHSLLDKWVAHTHSVYSNIILCSKSTEELLNKIFSDISYLYIPYVNPGSRLTLEIAQAINKYQQEHAHSPKIIFMENHGLIVHSDDMYECLNIHQSANERICDYFDINSSDYPEVSISELGENKYISNTEYLINLFKTKVYTEKSLLENPLYPDQMVYLEDTLGEAAIIDYATGKITYNMPYKQAILLEQSLTAILYIMHNITENNLEVKFMKESDQLFIKNWESEKYRKKISRQE